MKNWEILPKISEDFKNKYPEYTDIVLQLLWNRDLKDKAEIKKFLNPDFETDIHSPFLFSNMDEIVGIIIKHLKEKNKICVFGDYDVDGATSTAILYEVLTLFKGNIEYYIPDRVSEGYGLNKEAIKEIKDKGAKLIITVDNGIRNKEEVVYAKELGLEIIVTDHHEPPASAKPACRQGRATAGKPSSVSVDTKATAGKPSSVSADTKATAGKPSSVSVDTKATAGKPEIHEGLPDCLIVNPMVEDETYPFKRLAGVGVTYKLACALIEKSKLEDNDKKILEYKLFDLIAIGTVADMMPLVGENRVLVKKGLGALNKTSRPGLKKLIEIAGINKDKKIDAWNIGFQIGPRLNAAGRMDTAHDAFHLLITRDSKEATRLAQELNQKNIERQRQTEEMMQEIEAQIDKDGEILIGISTDKNPWNEGIVGLASGRITEKYYRPSLIITKNGNDYKGSGRSIEELNIIEVIEEVSDLLEKYGGHVGACGFSLKKENLDNFLDKIKKIVKEKLAGKDLKPKIIIEKELNLEDVNEKTIEQINSFSPFGQDNERPKFMSKNCQVLSIMNMGAESQHIKLRINSGDSNTFSAVGFSQAKKWENLKIGDTIDIVYYLELNEFNGRSEVQMKIVDIKSHNT